MSSRLIAAKPFTTVRIRDFFYTAGKKYGFPGSRGIGVGIPEDIVVDCLRHDEDVRVIVQKRYEFLISPKEILDIGNTYQSYHTAIRNGKSRRLIVIPCPEEDDE